MAKEFSKAFYHSAAWQRARKAYIESRQAIDGGMCELCGDDIGTEVHHKIYLRPENMDDERVTLNPENFALLCYNCHQLEHESSRRLGQLTKKQLEGKQRVLTNGEYYFDEAGEIQPFRVHIVWGCPGAGKTTYVREHMAPGDLVVDLDLLGRALSMADKTDVPWNIARAAMDVRDFIYKQIRNKKIDARSAWIVAGLPKYKQRTELAKQLKADLVFIDSTMQDCIRHILHDDERKDKALQVAIIEKWFHDFEAEPKQTAPIAAASDSIG